MNELLEVVALELVRAVSKNGTELLIDMQPTAIRPEESQSEWSLLEGSAQFLLAS